MGSEISALAPSMISSSSNTSTPSTPSNTSSNKSLYDNNVSPPGIYRQHGNVCGNGNDRDENENDKLSVRVYHKLSYPEVDIKHIPEDCYDASRVVRLVNYDNFFTARTKPTKFADLEGIIGAGKTTTINAVKDELMSRGFKVHIIKENVDEWVADGILQKFYEDPCRYAYHFQTKVFSDKVRTYIEEFEQYYGKVDYILTERSLRSDYIFASLLHTQGNMTEMEFKHYNQWYNMWSKMIPEEFSESLTVYIQITPELANERISQRNRDGESGITLEYQRGLHELHEKMFSNENNLLWDGSKDIYNKEIVEKLTDNIILRCNGY